MDFYKNSLAEPEKQNANCKTAINYLRQGRSAEAFLLLAEPGNEKDPAARFALALCHLNAGELPAAISCFEQALGILQAMPPKLPERPKTSETYFKLAVKQIAEKAYLAPLDVDFCELFPKAAEQTVLLALIDCFKQNGMIEKAKRLSSALTGQVFEEFKRSIL